MSHGKEEPGEDRKPARHKWGGSRTCSACGLRKTESVLRTKSGAVITRFAYWREDTPDKVMYKAPECRVEEK